jgi:Zn-dependent M28 family amino/carboxypeptidase
MKKLLAVTFLFPVLQALASPANSPATLNAIRDHAMRSNYAYERMADLTDLVGPRLSGSQGAAAAVSQVAEAMRQLGAKVTLQPVMVPRWVRGEERGEVVDYAGRPEGITQKIVLSALGGSSATPAGGLVAPVIIVRSYDELEQRKAEVKGKIVLFDPVFDQGQADRGHAGKAYEAAATYRYSGPVRASQHGAVAALVRSVGGANFRLPHTGSTGLSDKNRIPAAAVSVEDALLIGRLSKRGPVTLKLVLTPQILPDVQSYNVIADLPGTDKASEIVIVSGHLDSWDLGTGAHDDAIGLTSAMGVLEAFTKLGLKPRRTVRMIAWMNEENGSRGGRAYFEANANLMDKHFAAIESDGGAGRPFGFNAAVGLKTMEMFAPVQAALQPIGAGLARREDLLDTPDTRALENAGVPIFEPMLDSSSYFHYHHTAADTLDKVDPENVRRHVAWMSTLAWFLANTDHQIGRSPVSTNK